MHTSGKTLHGFRIIPDRSTWIEAQFDQHDLLRLLGPPSSSRKFLVTTFLGALLDWDQKEKDSDQKIIELFYDIENLQIEDLLKKDNVSNSFWLNLCLIERKGSSCKAFEPLTKTYLRAFQRLAKLN